LSDISWAALGNPRLNPINSTDLNLPIQARGTDKQRVNPKIDSVLSNITDTAQVSIGDALSLASDMQVEVLDERIQVQIFLNPDKKENVTALINSFGGEVTGSSLNNGILQSWIPVSAVEGLSNNALVNMIRSPAKAFLFGEPVSTSQGVSASNASQWHTAGITGSGVKIGIIDGGFTGYNALLDTDLPATVTVKNFVDGEDDSQVDGSSEHGTACAEVVHNMAPNADLYLAKISTNIDLQEAVLWLKDTMQVDVITSSLGFYNLTPGDGSGFFEDLAASAKSAGILWTSAAGNDRESHWGGGFSDINDNNYHDFDGSEINCFGNSSGCYAIPAGYSIRAFLRWDDWTTVNQDYDLYLYRYNTVTNGWEAVIGSSNIQDGGAGQYPTEYISYATTGDTTMYGIVVHKYNATGTANLELFVPKFLPMQQLNYPRSLANLADAASLLTVAAVDVNSPYNQESYSSEGPTNGSGGSASGGITKPDIAAYANVNTQSYGLVNLFNGTSAATPHVAGAAALVLEANSSYTPTQIQSYLENNAIDMGSAGKDTVFGAGRLYLGSAPSTDGVCGSSNGGSFDTEPTNNLCSTGTPGSVSGIGPWSWSCTGINGGSSANCSANINTYTVTPSTGSGGGIAPATPQTVAYGDSTSFTLTPDAGYSIGSITGTCGGSLSGNSYTTNAIIGNCSVSAVFTINSFIVSTNAGSGGSINPLSATVNYNGSTSFNIVSDSGYIIDVVSGCDGSLSGNTYTTGSITAACAVAASFIPAPIDASCGTTHGSDLDRTPSENLCSVGTAGAVSGTGPWSWSCQGLHGGSDSNCSANILPGEVLISKTGGLITNEGGGQDSFQVVLKVQPAANVIIPLETNNSSEGTVDKTSLTFTHSNWDQPQTVTVTGVDDEVQDANKRYQIITSAVDSTDLNYLGLDPNDIHVFNLNKKIKYDLGLGFIHSCVIDDSGVVCWGDDGLGKTTVPSLSSPKQVVAGINNACALDKNGVTCWGSNSAAVPALINPVYITTGRNHTCAIDDTGVVCWGADDYGQSTPVDIINPIKVTAGDYHTCAMGDDGVKCWGRDLFGETTPPAISNPTDIGAGAYHSCVLDDNGVKCWGSSVYTQVPNLLSPVQLAIGGQHSCVLDASEVKCWGSNYNNQITVPSLLNPVFVNSGSFHSCAIDDLELVCWGKNDYGEATVPSGLSFNGVADFDGNCGSSHNASFSSQPSENLCSAGTVSGLTGLGPWIWSCLGDGTGSDANCSASVLSNPACSSSAINISNIMYTSNTTESSAISISTANTVAVIQGISVTYQAPSITLTDGFQAGVGSQFIAQAIPVNCSPAELKNRQSTEFKRTATVKNKQHDSDFISHTEQLISPWLKLEDLPHTLYTILSDNEAQANDLQIDDYGEYISFSSRAALVPSDSNQFEDIYLYHIPSESLILVSSRNGEVGNGDSSKPRLNGDGEYLVYQSTASNLSNSEMDNNGVSDIYLYQICAGNSERISRQVNGNESAKPAANPNISNNGPYIVYDKADSSNQQHVYGMDYSDPNQLISRYSLDINEQNQVINSHQPIISRDGQFISFLENASEQNCNVHIYNRLNTDFIRIPCSAELLKNKHIWKASFGGKGKYIYWTDQWGKEQLMIENILLTN